LGPGLSTASEDCSQLVHSPVAATTAGGGELTSDATSCGPGAEGVSGDAAGADERSMGPDFRHADGSLYGTTVRWSGEECPSAAGVHADTPMVITPRPMDKTGSLADAGVAPVPRAGDAEP